MIVIADKTDLYLDPSPLENIDEDKGTEKNGGEQKDRTELTKEQDSEKEKEAKREDKRVRKQEEG